MDDTHALPSDALPGDPQECHRLLLAAYRQAQHLEQQVATSQQQAAQAQQKVAQVQQEAESLTRVLDETADSYAKLQQEHASKLEELAWYKRWVHGRRRERFAEAEGQQHLFELTSGDDTEETAAVSEEPRQPVAGHTRRRRRELDLSRLPHHRHELDLSPEEKVCSCCGREKDRIGRSVR
jgi:hypothetical protein